MASSKLSMFNIKLQGDISWNSVISKVLQMDSEDLHCIINEQSENYIGGYYLISITHNQKIYNFEENKFETITVKKQNIVKFDVFIISKKMLVWGNKRSSDIFITTLLQASNNQLIIDSHEIDYIQILNKLLTMDDIKFSKMKITDVLIDEGIVANCSVNLSSLDNPLHMVQKYMNCISQLTVTIEKDTNPTSLTLYSSGSVVISKDRDDIDDETLENISFIMGGSFNG